MLHLCEKKKQKIKVVVMIADWGNFKHPFSHKTYSRVWLGVPI